MASEDPTAQVEEWRAVVGYEGFYEVSDAGRVRSIRGDMTLRIRPLRNGYMTVALNVRGKKVKALVHRLVLGAFRRPPILGEVANHIDFDKTNNRPSNLEWTTPAGNSAHAKAAHRMNSPIGERHGGSKLTCENVREIRRLCSEGNPQRMVAEMFGVSQGHVGLIVSRRRWSHVPD